MLLMLRSLFGRKTPQARRSRTRSVAPRTRLGIESLEERVLLSGSSLDMWSGVDINTPAVVRTPLNYTAPSSNGSNAITLQLSGGNVQVFDNGVQVASKSIASTSSVSLVGGSNTHNTFNVLGTVSGIQTSINFTSQGDLAIVGNAGKVQGILGTLSIKGTASSTVIVDDSADTAAQNTTVNSSGVVVQLAGGSTNTINYSGVSSVIVKGNGSASDAVTLSASGAGNIFFDKFPGAGVAASGGIWGGWDPIFTGNNAAAVMVAGVRGTSYYLEADGFGHVQGLASSSSDVALLAGLNAGSNTVTATPKMATLSGGGYSVEADNFGQVKAGSSSTGDSATLDGASTGGNTLTGTPKMATLSGNGYSIEVDNFAQVTAHSHAFGDSASLDGPSTGSNTFTGTPRITTLSGNGYSIQADDFGQIKAHSHSSGDVAYLDAASTGINTFTAHPIDATLTSSGYSLTVSAFPHVTATNDQGHGVANLFGASSGTNTFTADRFYANLTGSGYSFQANDFDTVTAFSSSSSDAATLTGDSGRNTFTGDTTSCTLSGSGYSNKASGFPSATGKDQTGLLYFWTPSGGAHTLNGNDFGIGALYKSMGGPSSYLGFPTSDPQVLPNNALVQYFQHGKIVKAGGVAKAVATTSQMTFNFNIGFSDGTPVGGWAQLTVNADGSYHFTGHLYDSGFWSYNADVQVGILSVGGFLYTIDQPGHMAGTVESGPRDMNWDVSGTNSTLAANWVDLEGGYGYATTTVNGDFNPITNYVLAVGGVILSVVGLTQGPPPGQTPPNSPQA